MAESGPNLAMLASIEQAQERHSNTGGGAGLPANGNGIQSTVGGQVGQALQQSNIDQNLAGVGGVNPVPFKPSFDDDLLSSLFDGNMVPGNINYSDAFAVNNIAFGDVSASSAFGPQKALNAQEGGASFGNIGSITAR